MKYLKDRRQDLGGFLPLRSPAKACFLDGQHIGACLKLAGPRVMATGQRLQSQEFRMLSAVRREAL